MSNQHSISGFCVLSALHPVVNGRKHGQDISKSEFKTLLQTLSLFSATNYNYSNAAPAFLKFMYSLSQDYAVANYLNYSEDTEKPNEQLVKQMTALSDIKEYSSVIFPMSELEPFLKDVNNHFHKVDTLVVAGDVVVFDFPLSETYKMINNAEQKNYSIAYRFNIIPWNP